MKKKLYLVICTTCILITGCTAESMNEHQEEIEINMGALEDREYDTHLTTYDIELMDTSILPISDFFFKGLEGTLVSDENNIDVYKQNENQLVLSLGGIRYVSKESKKYEFLMERLQYDGYAINGKEYPLYSEIFSMNDLEFESKESCTMNILDYFKKNLNMELKLKEAYSVEGHVFESTQNKMLDEIEEDLPYDVTEGYEMQENYDSKDDFYVFYFDVVQEEIPLNRYGYSTSIAESARTYTGAYVEAWYSKEGLIFLDTGMLYDILQQSKEEIILTKEEAISIVEKHESNIISSDKSTILDIQLEYVPIGISKNYYELSLIPAWNILVETGNNETQSKDGNYRLRSILINALTSEILN